MKDIRVAANTTATSYSTEAVWPAMQGINPSATTLICNAGCTDLLLAHAPCKIVAAGSIGTIIERGRGGTIDACNAESPWVHRFKNCLDILLACNDDDNALGILDAPSEENVYEALAELEASRASMEAINAHPHKLLVLSGPETKLYPYFGTTPELPCRVAMTNQLWQDMCTKYTWGCVLYTAGFGQGTARLVVQLARLLGSYRMCSPEQVVVPFPPDFSFPTEAMHLLTCSKNVKAGSVRCSSTRGIVLQPTDFEDVVVTLVMQDNNSDSLETEDRRMQLLRQMLTSTTPADVGAACFELRASYSNCAVVRKAIHAVMKTQRDHEWMGTLEPPPIVRHASLAADHSRCR